MKKLLTTYNLSIVEGLMNWKDNLEKEFEGIDVGLLLHTGMCHLFLCDQPNFENDAKGWSAADLFVTRIQVDF